MKKIKIYSTLNLVIALIAFPLIVGYSEDALLLGLSICYSAAAISFFSYYLKKKDMDNSIGKVSAICANISLLLAIIVCSVESVCKLSLMTRIISIAPIIFVGGCFFLFYMLKYSRAE